MSNDYGSKIHLIASKFRVKVDFGQFTVEFFRQNDLSFQKYLMLKFFYPFFLIVISREQVKRTGRGQDNFVCNIDNMCANFYQDRTIKLFQIFDIENFRILRSIFFTV